MTMLCDKLSIADHGNSSLAGIPALLPVAGKGVTIEEALLAVGFLLYETSVMGISKEIGRMNSVKVDGIKSFLKNTGWFFTSIGLYGAFFLDARPKRAGVADKALQVRKRHGQKRALVLMAMERAFYNNGL